MAPQRRSLSLEPVDMAPDVVTETVNVTKGPEVGRLSWVVQVEPKDSQVPYKGEARGTGGTGRNTGSKRLEMGAM